MYMMLGMVALTAKSFSQGQNRAQVQAPAKKILILAGPYQEAWMDKLSKKRKYIRLYAPFLPRQIYPYPVGDLLRQAGNRQGFLPAATDMEAEDFKQVLCGHGVIVHCTTPTPSI